MLFATSRCGNSAYCWNTMLTGRLSGGSWVMSRPRRRIRPAVGSSKPPIMRSVVVLPQPEGPSSEKNSPGRISSETPSTARTAPNRFSRSMRLISAEPSLGSVIEGRAYVRHPRRCADRLVIRNGRGNAPEATPKARDPPKSAALGAPRRAEARWRWRLEARGSGRVPVRDRSEHDMNAYVAEIIAAERIAEFEREAAHRRLVGEARRGAVGHRAKPSIRLAALLAAAASAVTLWLAVVP